MRKNCRCANNFITNYIHTHINFENYLYFIAIFTIIVSDYAILAS